MRLLGLDHADIRVPSIAVIEKFYDRVLPPLGLSRKTEAQVDAEGEWHEADGTRLRNAIEYHTPEQAGSAGWFIGFIEDAGSRPTATRFAFTLDREAELQAIEALVRTAGGIAIEWSSDEGYPALFFEDPGGTRLEICARRPHV